MEIYIKSAILLKALIMNNDNKVRLLGFYNYFRQGSKVFNSKGRELTPDPQGRYKLKVYRGLYRYYRPPINAIVEDSRISQEEYDKLPVLDGFSSYRIKDNAIVTKTRRVLFNRKGVYHIKNDNNEYRNVKLN